MKKTIHQAQLVKNPKKNKKQNMSLLALFDSDGKPFSLETSSAIKPNDNFFLQRAVGPLSVVSIGDSHTETVGASTHFSGWVPLLTKALGSDGYGYQLHISPNANQAVNVVDANFNDNANPHALHLNAASARVRWYDLPPGNIVVMWLRVGEPESPEYAAPEFSFNNGTFSNNYSSENVVYAPGTAWTESRIDNFPGGTLALRKHATAPSGSFIFGIRFVNGMGTVSWFNWARSGYTTQVYANRLRPDPDGEWSMREVFQAWRPDVLHIGLGANDAILGIPSSRTFTNTKYIMSRIEELSENSDLKFICTLSPYSDKTISKNSQGVPSEAVWNQSLDAVSKAVSERNGLVIDLRAQGKESENLNLYIEDNHWNNAGHLDVANRLKNLLVNT